MLFALVSLDPLFPISLFKAGMIKVNIFSSFQLVTDKRYYIRSRVQCSHFMDDANRWMSVSSPLGHTALSPSAVSVFLLCFFFFFASDIYSLKVFNFQHHMYNLFHGSWFLGTGYIGLKTFEYLCRHTLSKIKKRKKHLVISLNLDKTKIRV